MNQPFPNLDLSRSLLHALRDVSWQPVDLWIAAIALGSYLNLNDVSRITAGARAPSRAEYNVLAAALNEEFMDLGLDHPMSYWDDPPATG